MPDVESAATSIVCTRYNDNITGPIGIACIICWMYNMCKMCNMCIMCILHDIYIYIYRNNMYSSCVATSFPLLSEEDGLNGFAYKRSNEKAVRRRTKAIMFKLKSVDV